MGQNYCMFMLDWSLAPILGSLGAFEKGSSFQSGGRTHEEQKEFPS